MRPAPQLVRPSLPRWVLVLGVVACAPLIIVLVILVLQLQGTRTTVDGRLATGVGRALSGSFAELGADDLRDLGLDQLTDHERDTLANNGTQAKLPSTVFNSRAFLDYGACRTF